MKKQGNEKMKLNLAGKTSGLVILHARPWSIVDWVRSGLERQERHMIITSYMAGRYVHGPLNVLGQALSKTKSPESVDSHALW